MAKQVTVRSYTSPTLVLLAMDWADGAKFKDFLGFAILRSPGFHPGEKDGYLLNKIGFTPPGPHSQSLPSNVSPIQKFLWWDSAITDTDRGKTFTYTSRACGARSRRISGFMMKPHRNLSKCRVPHSSATRFQDWASIARLVSSQSFSQKFPDPKKDLCTATAWPANGLQDGFAHILRWAGHVCGAIYHPTDNQRVMTVSDRFPRRRVPNLQGAEITHATTAFPRWPFLQKGQKENIPGREALKNQYHAQQISRGGGPW